MPSAASGQLSHGRERTPVVTPGLAAGFLGIITVLIVGVVVSFSSLGTVYRAAGAVAHTNAVKAELESLLASLIDAETGQRGFVITAQDEYLEPYRRAVADIPTQVARVRQLTSENGDQEADLDQVVADARVKLDELATAIRARRDTGFDAAQAVVRTNLGKRTMDAIRAVVARMEAREEARLAIRTAEADRAHNAARVTAVAIGAIGISVGAALFAVTRRIGIERTLAVGVAGELSVTLASIGDGVITTDAAGRVTHMNPVAERLTGWSATDAGGRTFDEIFVIVNEESGLPVENPIARVLREGVIVALANHTVLVARHGGRIPIDDSAAPIETEGAGMHGAVLVFRDVTDRRRTERERTRLIAELEAAVRTRDDFLSIAAHELRNPVNAVQLQLTGILRAFQRGAGSDVDGLRDRVAQANGQVGRLARLLDNLLDVSRITAGAIVIEPEDVELGEVVRNVIEQFRGESGSGQITFDLRHPMSGRWDRLRLEQVVSNVLSNAIKYGDGQPILVSLDGDGRAARLTMQDHGIGIAPDHHERLFAKFERGVSGRQYGGFGLGLWITRQLVEAMGGTISVESSPGRGSTFSIVLPLDGGPAIATRNV